MNYNKFLVFPYESVLIIDKDDALCYIKFVYLQLPESEVVLMDSSIERWYSMKEICEYLGVSRDTVLAWIEKRNMPAAKIGRLWKFKISEVDAWMKSGVASDK